MVDVESASVKEIPVTYYSAKKATPTLVRERPTAYLLKPGHEDVSSKTAGTRRKGFKLTEETVLSVEAYNVSSRIENEAYENKPNVDVQTIVKSKNSNVSKRKLRLFNISAAKQFIVSIA